MKVKAQDIRPGMVFRGFRVVAVDVWCSRVDIYVQAGGVGPWLAATVVGECVLDVQPEGSEEKT